ncbi:hypothetical protein [Agromyces humi]|nr:hypothetical protein [Agromyces humi]
MKVIGTIRRDETERIEVDADSYEAGVAELRSKVPEGWSLITVRTR